MLQQGPYGAEMGLHECELEGQLFRGSLKTARFKVLKDPIIL